jgi:hypothetical protein
MRGQPFVQAAEDRVVRNLGARFELLQPARERTQMLQPARPSLGVTAVMAVAPRPFGHDLGGQWTA